MALDESNNLDVHERAREKQLSRQEDQLALDLRTKSVEELRRENGHFAGLKVRVDLKRVNSLY